MLTVSMARQGRYITAHTPCLLLLGLLVASGLLNDTGDRTTSKASPIPLLYAGTRTHPPHHPTGCPSSLYPLQRRPTVTPCVRACTGLGRVVRYAHRHLAQNVHGVGQGGSLRTSLSCVERARGCLGWFATHISIFLCSPLDLSCHFFLLTLRVGNLTIHLPNLLAHLPVPIFHLHPGSANHGRHDKARAKQDP